MVSSLSAEPTCFIWSRLMFWGCLQNNTLEDRGWHFLWAEGRFVYLLQKSKPNVPTPWKGQIGFYTAHYKELEFSKLGIYWRPCKCAALRLPRDCLCLRSKQCKFAEVHEAVAGLLLTLLRPFQLLTRLRETVYNRNVDDEC